MTFATKLDHKAQDDKLVMSEFSGKLIPIASEAWRHECEVAFLLGLPAEKRKTMLYGVLGGEGDEARGIKHHRGDVATAQLVSEIERLKALRARGRNRKLSLKAAHWVANFP